MIENHILAEKCLQQLRHRGVKQFIICAGARNAPLVAALAERAAAESDAIAIANFFEERGAAFFALGRIKALNEPVAVITTSGTAVGNLLPAVMEAFHTNSPLVVVTADRPKLHRGSGSPQSTDQVGLFSHFVEAAVDWDGENHPPLEHWSGHKPFHFNICFSEPLLTGGKK
jgi:2-succinyl-5-enolpyruvyl-6-hydroxy-3-cyclohexene-1-carboxylate synthase